VRGPEAGAFAVWFARYIIDTKFLAVLMVAINVCWVIPLFVMLHFKRRYEREELGL
jgi:hypothetical protein